MAELCEDRLILPITLTIVVNDVDTQLAAGFDQIVIERDTSSDDGSGPFVEITTAVTRMALVSGITEYTFVDKEGSDVFFYRFRFRKTSNGDLSTPSNPFQQAIDPALDICSVQELKDFYLFGVDLTNDAGEPYPDSLFVHYIIAAVDRLEHRLDIPLRPLTIIEERQDYFREDYDKYIWVELNHTPVISVQKVRLVLPGEQVVQVFDQEWIHIDRISGQLQLVPGTGTAGTILLGASGAWIPLIYGNSRYIPDVFRIDYKAGFGKETDPNSVTSTAPGLDKFPRLIKDVVGKIASLGPFNIAGDLIVGAGIASQSLSIDGLSQSINTTSSATNAGYGARIIQYQKEIREDIKTLEDFYRGLRMRIV